MRARFRSSVGLMLAVSFWASSCGEQPAEEATPATLAKPDPDLVIAETRLGPISAGDVDRFLLDLPPAQRFDRSSDPRERFTEIARRIAIDRLLLDEAKLVGADQDPRFRVLERRIERQAASDAYLAGLELPPPITEEEARASYEENLKRYQSEEKRRLLHIYKRFGPSVNRDQAVAELTQVRERLLAGENFERLAREHSDSETRHQGGLVGEIGRGQFTNDFDQVVFALDEGVPSEPITTTDGAHLFLVQSLIPERNFDFEQVRTAIVQEVAAQRLVERRRQAAAELPTPQPNYLPTRQEIAELLRLGDPGTVLLRLGDFALTIAQFQEILQTERRLRGAKIEPRLPYLLLEELQDREIIYQHLESEDLSDVDPEQLRRAQDQELVQHFARQKMTSWIERQPELLQRHYDNNTMRFASPLRVKLRALSVPIAGDAGASLMARLESAKAELDAGDLQLDALASTHGGEIKDLGFVSAADVQILAPRALQFIFLLRPGEHTPPYSVGSSLVMFQVEERREPQPRPLALVRDQVVGDYLSHYSGSVFQQLGDQLLEENDFEIFTERLARMLPNPG